MPNFWHFIQLVNYDGDKEAIRESCVFGFVGRPPDYGCDAEAVDVDLAAEGVPGGRRQKDQHHQGEGSCPHGSSSLGTPFLALHEAWTGLWLCVGKSSILLKFVCKIETLAKALLVQLKGAKSLEFRESLGTFLAVHSPNFCFLVIKTTLRKRKRRKPATVPDQVFVMVG